jgi:hypothetical protein
MAGQGASLLPEIFELQGLVELEGAELGNVGLEIVMLLSGTAVLRGRTHA